MSNGRDLDIANLACQANLINSDQFDQVMRVWSANQMIPMGEILESSGLVDPAGRARLERLANQGHAVAANPLMATQLDDASESQTPAVPPTVNSWVEEGPGETVAAMPAKIKPLDEYATVASESVIPIIELSPSGQVKLTTPGKPDSSKHRTRYARTHLHATGGIGQVWLARDSDLGREVALKELRPEQGDSTDAWSRFVDEARITGQLEHPGIVPVYELSVDPEDGDPFYTMRFVRGKTLDRSVRDYHKKRSAGQAGPLDLASLLTAFVSLCNTVGYAHSRGVIHRDLKGQNVVLGDFGEVVLLDWGIAKLMNPSEPTEPNPALTALPVLLADTGSEHKATVHGQVIGTPFYMAPEQAEGRIEEIDTRTDVYGLGAILYEILSGQVPYDGTSMGDVLRKVIKGALVSPRVVNPTVSPALEAICLKAMAKQPEDRYPSALALAEEVRRWLADEPVSVYREPWTIRLARYSKRHRTAVTSAAALLITAVVGLSVSSILISRERDEARRQRQQARKAVDDSYTRVAEEWLADRLDPLQREFLEKALAYYSDFAGPDDGDPSLRQERGRAHLRMGDVLRKLGRPAEAEAAYRRSIDILGRLAQGAPAVEAYRESLAEATFRLGSERATRNGTTELDEAAQLFGSAASIQEALLNQGVTPARRVALGRTLNALADLLRVSGQADKAEATYRRAIALLERAGSDGAGGIPSQQELGVALDSLGFLLKERGRIDEATITVRQAVQVFEKLVAEAPTLPAPKDGLAKVYNTLSLLLRDAGTPAEADAILEKEGPLNRQHAILEKEVALNRRLAEDYPQRPEYQRTLARALLNLGVIYRDAARLKDDYRLREAEAAYTEALKLNEKLAAETPEIRKYTRDQARCLSNLGEIKASRKTDSEPLYRRALKIHQDLAKLMPGVPEHRIDEAGVLQNLGDWFYKKGRTNEAIETLGTAVARFEGLAVADSNDPGVRRGLARSLNSLGSAYLAGGRNAEAEEAYGRAANAFDLLVNRPAPLKADRLELASCLSNRGSNQTTIRQPGAEGSLQRSLALLEALAKEGEPTPDLRFRLAATRNNLGEWLVVAGQPRDAEVAFQESINEFSSLAGEFSKNPLYTSILGQVRANLGEFLVAQGRPDDARTLLEQGIREERTALAATPEARETLRKHLATLAALDLKRRAYVEVAKAGEEMLKLANSVPAAQSDLARLMASCVPLAAADDKLTAARRTRLSGAYADRAIALLREATENGGPEAGRLLQDPTFDPIRERDGFKALEPEKLGQQRSVDSRSSTE